MSKFSAIDPKYKAFRCFAVYNCNTQSVIVQIQRQCGNLYTETIMKVKDFVKQNLQDSQRNQLFISTGPRCEWHGILEEKSNCYFLMMTFPGTQPAEVRASLLDLQFTVMGINNYTKYADENFPKQKKDELMIRIDDLEKKYVEKYGGEGQPNENEIQKINQGSQISPDFLQSKPLQIHPSKASQKIQEPYRKHGVYRCFMVFNVLSNQILFLQKRGTGKSFTETEKQLIQKLKTQINETTKFDFFMQGNIRSEWHGILDEQKSCYFLMMTFPSSTQKNVREALNDLKKIITTYPNYDRASYNDLERRFKTEIQKSIDNLEIKYHNIVGNEGVPSEEESKLRDSLVFSNPVVAPNTNQQQPNQNNQQQQSSKISLNPPMSKIEEGLNPPEIGDSNKKLIKSTEIEKEVKFESFKPNAQDAIKFLFAGVGFSFIIFTVLLVDLYS